MKNNQLCTGYESPIGISRRESLSRFGGGLGGIALANMLGREAGASPGALNGLHHGAKAKRVIYLFQSGGPSQIDLFDHKPRLIEETVKNYPIRFVRASV